MLYYKAEPHLTFGSDVNLVKFWIQVLAPSSGPGETCFQVLSRCLPKHQGSRLVGNSLKVEDTWMSMLYMDPVNSSYEIGYVIICSK